MTSHQGRGKVAVVFHDGLLGGASLSVLRTVPVLEERGWRFAFWGPPGSPLAEYLAAQGRRLHGAPRQIGYSLVSLRQPPGMASRLRTLPAYFREFRRFLRAEPPALVHANTLYTLAEALVARAHRLPVLLHLHEMVPDSYKGAATAELTRRTGIDVVAVSEACAARYARGRDHACVVYEGASVPEVIPNRNSRDRLVVGTVGVISRRKGSDLFVEAVRRIRRETDRVDCRLVGSPTDPLDAAWGHTVLEHARHHGIDHVEQADAAAELRDWDVFVLPSRRDPFPIVVLEAMASALPVVGTKVDGLAEQVTPETGVLTDPEDSAGLADAVLRLVHDGDARQAMGAAGRRRVEQLFTVERQAEGMHEAYLAALQQANREGSESGSPA